MSGFLSDDLYKDFASIISLMIICQMDVIIDTARDDGFKYSFVPLADLVPMTKHLSSKAA